MLQNILMTTGVARRGGVRRARGKYIAPPKIPKKWQKYIFNKTLRQIFFLSIRGECPPHPKMSAPYKTNSILAMPMLTTMQIRS